MSAEDLPAPELDTTGWLNTPAPLALADLRGRVVVLHAFQMLCPGCVSHALPQAEALHRQARDGLAVIGLHCVFEHHHAMGPEALRAFVHEYRLTFPIGIDRQLDDGPIPSTMRGYGMRGTPTLILIDRDGRQRLHRFGRISDLELGLAIGRLLAGPAPARGAPHDANAAGAGRDCDDTGCVA